MIVALRAVEQNDAALSVVVPALNTMRDTIEALRVPSPALLTEPPKFDSRAVGWIDDTLHIIDMYMGLFVCGAHVRVITHTACMLAVVLYDDCL